MADTDTEFLHFLAIATQDAVAVYAVGRYRSADGEISTVASCDIYEFRDGVVSTITSYTIELTAPYVETEDPAT